MGNSKHRYGVPYQGSKNQIAEWVVDFLPAAHNFVDVFAGGCAITHRAMMVGRWNNFIANDLSSAPDLFYDVINGRYANEDRWITREQFYELKEQEPYIKYCWSFQNNGSTYIFGKGIYEWKRALFELYVHNDDSLIRAFGVDRPNITRADIRHNWKYYNDKYYEYCGVTICKAKGGCKGKSEEARNIEMLTIGDTSARIKLMKSVHEDFVDSSIERSVVVAQNKALKEMHNSMLDHLVEAQTAGCIKNINSLKGEVSTNKLLILHQDYRDIQIPANSLIYCDPPYKNTVQKGYGDKVDGKFDYEAFYSWVKEQAKNNIVVISEYNMPDEFVCLGERSKQNNMAGNTGKHNIEKLFVLKSQLDAYNEAMKQGSSNAPTEPVPSIKPHIKAPVKYEQACFF